MKISLAPLALLGTALFFLQPVDCQVLRSTSDGWVVDRRHRTFGSATYRNHLNASTSLLKPGSDWDHLEYSLETSRKPSCDWDEPQRLSDWLLSCERDITHNATSEERSFDYKSVALSCTVSRSAELTDMKVERSSGSDEIDKRAMMLVRKLDLRKVGPPPDAAPLSGILVRFPYATFLRIDLKPVTDPRSVLLPKPDGNVKPSGFRDFAPGTDPDRY